MSQLKLGTFGSGSTGYSNTKIDTWLKNLTIEAGGAITPRMSVGVEFTPPSAEVRFAQQYGYVFSQGYKANIRYRESTVFVVAGLNSLPGQVPYVRLTLVGGGGRVLGRSASSFAVELRPPAGVGYGPFSEERENTGGSFAVILGGDIGFPVHRHLEIVTQGRLLFIDRGDPVHGGAFQTFGLFDKVPRGGVGARVKF